MLDSPLDFYKGLPRHRDIGKLEPAYQLCLADPLFEPYFSDVPSDMNFILLDLLAAHVTPSKSEPKLVQSVLIVKEMDDIMGLILVQN